MSLSKRIREILELAKGRKVTERRVFVYCITVLIENLNPQYLFMSLFKNSWGYSPMLFVLLRMKTTTWVAS